MMNADDHPNHHMVFVCVSVYVANTVAAVDVFLQALFVDDSGRDLFHICLLFKCVCVALHILKKNGLKSYSPSS